jgi:hypothetical protein
VLEWITGISLLCYLLSRMALTVKYPILDGAANHFCHLLALCTLLVVITLQCTLTVYYKISKPDSKRQISTRVLICRIWILKKDMKIEGRLFEKRKQEGEGDKKSVKPTNVNN